MFETILTIWLFIYGIATTLFIVGNIQDMFKGNTTSDYFFVLFLISMAILFFTAAYVISPYELVEVVK